MKNGVIAPHDEWSDETNHEVMRDTLTSSGKVWRDGLKGESS